MRLELPESPFFPNPVIEPGEKLLDELARAYAGDDPLAFLFAVAPTRVFERVIGCEPADLPMGPHL